MAFTNFAALTDEQKTVWSRRFWRHVREKAFVGKFLGTDENAMIHRITELKKDEKGTRAVLTLIHDLQNDGTAGDRFLEGNEEAMTSSDQVIRIDQLRHAVRNKGRMADQKTIVNFRNTAMNNLSYWHAERWDQMAFLTLSGISYAFYPNGGHARPATSDLQYLEFAEDVTPPSTNRHFRWDGSAKDFVEGNTEAVTTDDKISYGFVVEAKRLAYDKYIRPLREKAGVEWFNMFVTPRHMAQLKLDPDFKSAYQNALPRTPDNPIFKGTDVVYLDGIAIHTYRQVYNNLKRPDTQRWGSDGNVNGSRILLCGAQALGMADIGQAYWDEKKFDYNNQPGIAVGKIAGYLKPRFHNNYDGSTEDYGVLCLDTAL